MRIDRVLAVGLVTLALALSGMALATGRSCSAAPPGKTPASKPSSTPAEPETLQRLDAPLLFVKRHSYSGTHIYDTFYTWLPGGDIDVLENASGAADTMEDSSGSRSRGASALSPRPEWTYQAPRSFRARAANC